MGVKKSVQICDTCRLGYRSRFIMLTIFFMLRCRDRAELKFVSKLIDAAEFGSVAFT